MLRITTADTASHLKLILQGHLAGPFVAELQSTWESAGRAKCMVDLTDVTFVDEEGARVLCAMKDAGVKFIARGVDTMQLLEDLKRKTEPSLRRCLSWLTSDTCRKDKTPKL
jgi:anti-anti-sigma regulatory factor